VWIPVVVALGLLALFVVPALPGLAPTTRPVEPGERVAATTASFAPAQGWTLDLDAAVSSRPVVTSDGVMVRLSDGVWFGSSADLLARMAELLREAGAEPGTLPDAPSDDALVTFDPDVTPPATIPRTEYVIDFTLGGDPGELMVVREDAGVALLRTTGPEAAIADRADDIEAMKASVDVGVVSVDDVPRDPQSLREKPGPRP
jgi:hypothetical protein